jgi:hypothetical protein
MRRLLLKSNSKRGGIVDIISQSKPKAIKDHICMWCNGLIKKGEVYNKTVIKNDYIYAWINHEKCSDLYQSLKMYNHENDGIDSDNFMEYVYEFLYSKLSEEENDALFGEEAVDKAVELLKKEGQ